MEPARLPSVRSLTELKEAQKNQKSREALSVNRLGSIRRLAQDAQTGAETVQRLCDKYQSFMSDDEIAVGEVLRREISREARQLIAEGVGHIETTCRKIINSLWGGK